MCDCGDVVVGNGIVRANDQLYFLSGGKLTSGWQTVGFEWCYADPATYQLLTGEHTISGRDYLFGEDDECDCCDDDCDCDCCDEGFLELECPKCGEVICIDEDYDEDEIICPACNEKIEIDD